MITRNNLPNNYSPFETLTVCSNVLMGGGNIVAVGEVLPILIGKGKIPKVWLQAIGNAQKNEFVTIVEESISKHPAVKVYEESNSLNIMVSGEIILSIKVADQNSAFVDTLDFRPIGLNMYGNVSSLNVGGSSYSNNSMSGGGTLIGLG